MLSLFKKKNKIYISSQHEINRIKIPEKFVNEVVIFYCKFKSNFIYTGFYAYKDEKPLKETLINSADQKDKEVYLIIPPGSKEIAIRNSSQKNYDDYIFDIKIKKFFSTEEFHKKFLNKQKNIENLLHSFPRTGNTSIRKYFNKNQLSLLQSHFIHPNSQKLKSKYDQEVILDDVEILEILKQKKNPMNILIGIRDPLEIMMSYLIKEKHVIEKEFNLINFNWTNNNVEAFSFIKTFLTKKIIPLYNSWWENDFLKLYNINIDDFKSELYIEKYHSCYLKENFKFFFYETNHLQDFIKIYLKDKYKISISEKFYENQTSKKLNYLSNDSLNHDQIREIENLIQSKLSINTRNLINILYKKKYNEKK